MHRCSVFKNSCLNVPIDPLSKMPKTAYERNETNLTEQCSMESLTSCSIFDVDVDAEKLKDFYKSIPDYCDINHLTEGEFYKTLKILREKKKLMLGLAVEHDNIYNIDNDKLYDKLEKDLSVKKNMKISRKKNKEDGNIDKRDIDIGSIKSLSKETIKIPVSKFEFNDGAKRIKENKKKEVIIDNTENNLTVKTSKLERPKRNHSACSISWHDDKVDNKNEIDKKFQQYFETNKSLNDEEIYKTQSMPSSPLRTQRLGSIPRRRRKSITIPKPFKMTERDDENIIVSELRSIQKSFSDDLLHQKVEKKKFRAKPVPIESRIPLYDKILEDQAMRRAISKINSEAELRAQMKPFSFTKREESGGICDRAANVMSKPKKKKRFKARPVPKNLFTNYFYDRIKEDNYFRSMNRRIRAEEMLRSSNFPGTMALRDRSRLSTPAAHSDLPIDPSVSSDRQRSTSPIKGRKVKNMKDDFVTTSPQPFHFNTAERASKKMSDISKRVYRESKSSVSENSSLQKNMAVDKSQAYSALDLKTIAAGRSNLAALLRAETVRQKFDLEAAKRLSEQRRKTEHRHRDRLLRSNPAWHMVKNNHEEDIAIRLQTRRDEERMRREEFLHEMELMYGRVQRQPMLFERYYAPRSGATTVDSIQLSPRKSPTKKRNIKKTFHPPSSMSSECREDLLKCLDKIHHKKLGRSALYEDNDSLAEV